MRKIKVICREFINSHNKIDVDSRMFDEDGQPLIGKNFVGEDRQLGQISSSFSWAKNDISNHFKVELNKCFPDGYEFDFQFVALSTSDVNVEIQKEELRLKLKALALNNVIVSRCMTAYLGGDFDYEHVLLLISTSLADENAALTAQMLQIIQNSPHVYQNVANNSDYKKMAEV